MHLKTRNINTAFRELVEGIHTGKIPTEKRSSRNGGVLQVTDPFLITYERPRERVLFNISRDANPFFHCMEALWMLAGRNDVAPLAYYASNMANYSDDGKTLNGAYGYRWRRGQFKGNKWDANDGTTAYEPGYIDQLGVLVQHLKADPTSRRAVLQMWNVEDDLLKIGKTERIRYMMGFTGEGSGPLYAPGSKDVCCNLSVMFSIRLSQCYDEANGPHLGSPALLDMTITNRSNDMVWGMLGANYVHFTFLQEYMAARLGVEVGVYHHFTNNLHVYENNWKPVEWLDYLANYSGWPDGHYRGQDRQPLKMVPLVSNIETFEKELPKIVETWSGENPNRKTTAFYKEPFLEDVASPMFHAYLCYKRKDFSTALEACETIRADDWRTAAITWIVKREKKHDDASGRQGEAGGAGQQVPPRQGS